MRVMGRFNWWAPKPLAQLHKRFPMSSEFTPPPGRLDTPISAGQ
jgi:RND superfamily putative drug exporter